MVEYLAAPRVLFCSKCNEPGHSKKQCTLSYERCKRCDNDRNDGEHKECEIKCHHCNNDHISIDFKCPAIKSYRCDLIQILQQQPEVLPEDIQLFIPSQYRRQSDRTLVNQNSHSYQTPTSQHLKNRSNNEEWPVFTSSSSSFNPFGKPSYAPNLMDHIPLQLNQMENACSKAKEEYDKRNVKIKYQMKTSIVQIHSLIACFSTVIQKQNETMSILKNAINESLEFNRITNQALCFVIAKSGDQ